MKISKFYIVPKMGIARNMCVPFLFSLIYFFFKLLLFTQFEKFNLMKTEFFLAQLKCSSSFCSTHWSFIRSIIHVRIAQGNSMLLFLPSFRTRDLLMFEMAAPSVTGE